MKTREELEEIVNQFHCIKTKNNNRYTYLFNNLNEFEIIRLVSEMNDQIEKIIVQYLWTPETSSIIDEEKTILYYADEELSREIKDIEQLKNFFKDYEGYFEEATCKILLDVFNEKIEILYVR